jgi:hypothetical protein
LYAETAKASYSPSAPFGASNFKKADGKITDWQSGTASTSEKKLSQWQSAGSGSSSAASSKFDSTVANFSASEPTGNYDADTTSSGTLQLSGCSALLFLLLHILEAK